jgi:hypothetical protein
MDDKRIEQFFNNYAAQVNAGIDDSPEQDKQAAAAVFADCFIGASPQGVFCEQNGEKLLEHMTTTWEYYRSIGTRGMHLVSVDYRPLDALHGIAEVNWRADYIKKDGSALELEFRVIYLLQELPGSEPKVFAFITGDEQQAYRDHGLI